MADGRMLKKEISDSEKLGRLKGKDKARVLYFMMFPHLDVKGRLKAKPRQIKGRITTELEYSERTIQRCLEALHDVELLTLYRINGDQFIEYTRFLDFQKINPEREAKSKIPAPTPENSRPTPENSVLSEAKAKLSKVKLSEGKENEKPQKKPPSLLSLSHRFKKDLEQYILPATQADRTFISNLERRLMKEIQKENFTITVFTTVVNLAEKSRKADKPIAYFRSIVEKELGIKV